MCVFSNASSAISLKWHKPKWTWHKRAHIYFQGETQAAGVIVWALARYKIYYSGWKFYYNKTTHNQAHNINKSKVKTLLLNFTIFFSLDLFIFISETTENKIPIH